MSNQWFRLYTEFAFDPKVQVLTEALQRRYVMALCLHCDDKLENRPDDEIALALRVTVDEWKKTKEDFLKRGLFSDAGIPTAWDKRQYISDLKDPTAANRQKRYRQNKRNDRNATVTSRLPEADTDTDTDTEKKERKGRGTRFALQDPPGEWIQFCQKQRPDLQVGVVFDGFRDYWLAKPGKDGIKLDWFATWRNWIRNQKTGNKHENSSGNNQFTKSKWVAEGERLIAKYAAQADALAAGKS